MDKRLVFTVTSGRSGTMYVTHLLSGLPGIASLHEATPGFHGQAIQARHDGAVAKKFWTQSKLPAIAAFSEPTYIETSHYFCKGYVESLLDLDIVPDLILLRRHPRKVARSWFLIGGGVRELRAGEYYKHMLGPHEPNFLRPSSWEHWNDYQFCYWYALESHYRTIHYARLIAARGGKTFETYLQPLAVGNYYADMLSWLNIPNEIVQFRINDQKLRQRRINDMLDKKQSHGRVQAHAALTPEIMDELEAKLHEDCGLSTNSVEEMLRSPIPLC